MRVALESHFKLGNYNFHYRYKTSLQEFRPKKIDFVALVESRKAAAVGSMKTVSLKRSTDLKISGDLGKTDIQASPQHFFKRTATKLKFVKLSVFQFSEKCRLMSILMSDRF